MDATRERRLMRVIRAMGSGDVEDAREATAELLTSDAEWHSALATRAHHGPDGVLQWLRLLTEGFADYRVEFDHLVEDGDVVVTFHHFHGIFAVNGVVVERKIGIIWEFRGERCFRTHSHIGWDEAYRIARAGAQTGASTAPTAPPAF